MDIRFTHEVKEALETAIAELKAEVETLKAEIETLKAGHPKDENEK